MGENLKQQCMGNASVNDVCCSHPLGKGTDAALRLRRHPTSHGAVIDELTRFGKTQFANEGQGVLPFPEYAWCVGEQNQFLCFKGCCEFPCLL